MDTPATREQKAALGKLSAEQVTAGELAGEKILAALTTAPGNGAAIGGLKVVTESWPVRRPPVGHRGRRQALRRVFPAAPAHLAAIQEEARAIIARAIGGS